MSDDPADSNDANRATPADVADAVSTTDGPPVEDVAETDRSTGENTDRDASETAEGAEPGKHGDFESSGSGMRGRDVEVPMRVYKTVTVFSTLIAVVCVVGGFIILDRATRRAQLPLSEVDPVLAVLGIATILFGAATYAFGTRFRASGMGRSKNDDDEAADNG